MTVIVDYGLGNLASIKNMLRYIGFQSTISGNPNDIKFAERIILPGVGAFDNGIRNMRERGLIETLNEKVLGEKVPTLGICLGMQLMTEGSEEGLEPGLGWINGMVKAFRFPKNETLRVPHMGWNIVSIKKKSEITRNFLQEMRFYFVHSYHVVCKEIDDILLTTDYGGEITAAILKDNIVGTQFHPEKSHRFGMLVLKNFMEMDHA